jgi:hypothetical protein
MMSKQSSTESGPSSSNRLSRQSSSETTQGGPSVTSRNPYQSWHGTPRADAQRRPNGGPELNSLPRRHRRPSGTFNDQSAAIPLIEYSLVGNGGQSFEAAEASRHYATLGHGGRGGLAGPNRAKMQSDMTRRSYDNSNHCGGLVGNHMDSEAAEAEDYYPDTSEPTVHRGNSAYVKYNSFANY